MKILMVGALAKSRFFPSDLTDTEVWGLNAIYPTWVPRWDRRFNLHTHENLVRYKWKEAFFERETQFSHVAPDVPFYTLDPWPYPHELAGWKQFPAEQMMRDMTRGRYHCASFDWMVAFAIWLNQQTDNTGPGRERRPVDEIVLHGCQLTMEAGEPISARACLEYWCGRAEGAGIGVSLAGDAKLFDFYHLVRSDLVYGIDDTPVVEDEKAADIVARLAIQDAPYDYEE